MSGDHSIFSGATTSIQSEAGSTVRVATSQLVGPATNNGSPLTCLFSYNGAYASLDSACQ